MERFEETARFAVPEAVAHSPLAGDETVMLNLDSGLYFGAEQAGHAIWAGVSAGKTVGEIRRGLEAAYDADPERIGNDLQAFLAALVEKGLAKPA